jgi:hypothetical protein
MASVDIRGQGIEEWGGCGIAFGLYFFEGFVVGGRERLTVDRRKSIETARATATCCGSILRTWGAAVLRPYEEVRSLGGAGFDLIDEVAEVAFGVAAVGVAAFFVLSGDFVHQFVDGAAFRGWFVEFELRSQAAQEFCCFEHDEEILKSEGEATNRTLVLGDFLRNSARFFSWREYQRLANRDC